MSILAAACNGFPMYDVEDGEALEVNPGQGTAFSSVSTLDASRVIECYADYGNDGAGTCKLLSVQDKSVTEEGSLVFNANRTQYIKVASFSPSSAVVCYSDHAGTEHLTCRSLAIGGSSMTAHAPYTIDDAAVDVSFLDVASFTHEIGIVCWSEPLSPDNTVKDRAGVCNKLTVGQFGEISVGQKAYIDQAYSTSDITVQAFTDTSAVVCWSAQGTGECMAVSLSDTGSASSDFNIDPYEVYTFFQGAAEAFKGLELVKFTEARGLVCYADKIAKNKVDCRSLYVNGTSISYGEVGEVTPFPSLWLTADALTEDAAIVCYAANPQGSVVDAESFDGKGTCNIVGLLEDGSSVGAGPPVEVNSRATQHMTVVSFDDRSGVLCYSDGGAGAGNCKALSMAETTTSTTATTTTTESSTTTETTTPHTTTETTTSSETSTTSVHTTTETFTTTSPHTTTETATTITTTMPESEITSGSPAPGLLGAFAALSAALAAALS